MCRVVLNATTLVKGGALQACVSFIREAIASETSFDWYFLLSTEISEQLRLFGVDVDSLQGQVISPTPAKNKQSRKKLFQTVDQIKPEAVFTFFGPAYVSFNQPHLMGVADGWITHSTRLALKKKGGLAATLKLFFLFLYKRYWYKKADHWVVEADCARQGMVKRFGIAAALVDMVSNNCGDHYSKSRTELNLAAPHRCLVLSAYYPHKNLELIPYVAVELKKRRNAEDCIFTLTLEKGCRGEQRLLSAAKRLGVEKMMNNIGPVAVKDGPKHYRQSSLSFMPSLLETFSAVYPESMISGKPIVTSDLGFAHDICKDAALYFNPLNAVQAAEKIDQLLNNPILYQDLVEKGYRVFDALPNQKQKYSQYTAIVAAMLKDVR